MRGSPRTKVGGRNGRSGEAAAPSRCLASAGWTPKTPYRGPRWMELLLVAGTVVLPAVQAGRPPAFPVAVAIPFAAALTLSARWRFPRPVAVSAVAAPALAGPTSRRRR